MKRKNPDTKQSPATNNRKGKRYPGTIVRRGDTFWLHLSVGGKRYYFTVPTTDRRYAEKFASEKHSELTSELERTRSGLPSGIRLSQLVDMYEREQLPTLATGTRSAYGDSLKVIRRYFVVELGDPLLGHVRAKHIAGFLSWRRVNSMGKAGTVSNRTLQKDRAVLHRIFAIAEKLEYRDGNPVARISAPKSDPREPVILTSPEYDRLIKACENRPMLELYILVMGEAGLRCESEALRLQWEDVDLEGGFLWISSSSVRGHRTKGGKGRHCPMTSRLAAAMRQHFADHRFASYAGERPPWVFHHPVTQGMRLSGRRIGSMRNSFRNAARRAKLSDALHQHDLRHRRVTTWLAEGRDVVLVKEAMGHADLRTTMGYTHLAKEHLRRLIDSPDVLPLVKSDSKAG